MSLARPVRSLLGLLLLTSVAATATQAGVVTATFEDVNPGTDTYRNDFRPDNRFNTGGFTFNNSYNATWGVWSGFAVSSKIDNVFTGLNYERQYGAYAPQGASGTGAGGSATYGIAYNFSEGDALINLPDATDALSMDVTNTTYTAMSIVQGDAFARAFSRGDYLRLDILGYTGLNGSGGLVASKEFYLADYRGETPQVISDWTTIDLTSLAGAQSLAFRLTTTDVGIFGPNTPMYFAVDNVRATTRDAAVPEPGTLAAAGLGLIVLAVARRRLAA